MDLDEMKILLHEIMNQIIIHEMEQQMNPAFSE